MISTQIYNVSRLTSSAAIKSSAGRVIAVNLFGGSAATSIKFENSADGSGTPLLDINVVANDTRFVDLSELGGVAFSTAIYGTLAGAGGIVEVWYD